MDFKTINTSIENPEVGIISGGSVYQLTESITDEELKAFMHAMNKRYGLDFTNYEIKSLKRGVSRLLIKHGMKSMLDLWTRILKDDGFFKRGIDDLLVNLTEMFRNPEAWRCIRDNVLKTYDKDKALKVWHAGCSTGEEVYTMAIVLQEMNFLDQASLLGTDLSAKALRKARKGAYEHSILDNHLNPFLKFYPGKSLSDYFDLEDAQGVIRSSYKKNINFMQHNLVSQNMRLIFDIVFCRNVMIYFDEKLKNHVLSSIHDALCPKGILVLGYYDMMTEHGKSLFEVLDLKTKIYIKK